MVLTIPAVAGAQYLEPPPPPTATAEVTGGWGVNLGETDYLPSGSFKDFKHPFVTGWNLGGTLGWLFAPNLAVIATYEYRTATTREGNVPGVIDSVEGSADYHTAVFGLRLYHPVGAGRLRADMAAGVVFPFETELEFEWGPALAPAGITGEGKRTDEYGPGLGLQAGIGYEIPIGGPLFLALGVEVRAFQTNNNEEETRLENVVTDFNAQPPVGTNATVEYGDGKTQPFTFPAADIGARLSLGTRF